MLIACSKSLNTSGEVIFAMIKSIFVFPFVNIGIAAAANWTCVTTYQKNKLNEKEDVKFMLLIESLM